ncbi:MAG: membrane protein insertase YidC [Alphaproteobacteria bacterium]
MQDQRNFILFILISFGLLMTYQFFVPEVDPTVEEQQIQQPAIGPENLAAGEIAPPAPAAAGVDGSTPLPTAQPVASAPRDRGAVIGESDRIEIRSSKLSGSIRLKGGRIDDLMLLGYHVDLDENSPYVTLLSPAGTANPYFADFGWISTTGSNQGLPNPGTVWRADRTVLEPGTPVTLTWDNGAGLTFTRVYTLDENYMLDVVQRVENRTGQPVNIQPYGVVDRTGTPDVLGFFILHEGLLGVLGGELKEVDYDDIQDDPVAPISSTDGWLGITDKYWLMALIPEQGKAFTGEYSYLKHNNRDRYRTSAVHGLPPVESGAVAETTTHLFAGAKVSALIDGYAETLNIKNFDRAIDWGWFYWLTRPLFWLLMQLQGLVGNFGVAILLVTVLIKAAFFTLANKSYVAMSKMRKVQPKMKEIQEKFKDDQQKQREAMFKLYQDEKVNPVSGCLPMLVQIPVFFALYKVLFVSIEMRHAPFFGWVKDLSAPDPLLITNLFGLIPFDPPTFLAIGLWPVLMGLSMWGQQKLNPAPPDKIQARIFMFLPILFTFMLAGFPVGLVIYWTWNNVLTIAQQWVIMKRHGAFDND